jgi:hypothetical protein
MMTTTTDFLARGANASVRHTRVTDRIRLATRSGPKAERYRAHARTLIKLVVCVVDYVSTY